MYCRKFKRELISFLGAFKLMFVGDAFYIVRVVEIGIYILNCSPQSNTP